MKISNYYLEISTNISTSVRIISKIPDDDYSALYKIVDIINSEETTAKSKAALLGVSESTLKQAYEETIYKALKGKKDGSFSIPCSRYSIAVASTGKFWLYKDEYEDIKVADSVDSLGIQHYIQDVDNGKEYEIRVRGSGVTISMTFTLEK